MPRNLSLKARKRPLPARITLAIVLVLMTAAWNLARLWSSLSLWHVLQEFTPSPGPAYIAVTGAIWGGLGIAVALAAWRRVRWASPAMLAAALAYTSWYWGERIVFQPNPDPGWRFSVLMTILQLGLIAAATLDPRNRLYFGKEAHEREEQDR